jgi:hypothetical protein
MKTWRITTITFGLILVSIAICGIVASDNTLSVPSVSPKPDRDYYLQFIDTDRSMIIKSVAAELTTEEIKSGRLIKMIEWLKIPSDGWWVVSKNGNEFHIISTNQVLRIDK